MARRSRALGGGKHRRSLRVVVVVHQPIAMRAIATVVQQGVGLPAQALNVFALVSNKSFLVAHAHSTAARLLADASRAGTRAAWCRYTTPRDHTFSSRAMRRSRVDLEAGAQSGEQN